MYACGRYLGSPPPPEEEAAACVLRAWVEAVVEYDQVSDETSMTVEQHTCTPAMQAACECVCDLFGLQVEPDTKLTYG